MGVPGERATQCAVRRPPDLDCGVLRRRVDEVVAAPLYARHAFSVLRQAEDHLGGDAPEVPYLARAVLGRRRKPCRSLGLAPGDSGEGEEDEKGEEQVVRNAEKPVWRSGKRR